MAIRVKSRKEILNDIINDAKKQPSNWKAVFGRDTNRFSNDYYLFHPDVGLYFLKEYDKNPFNQIGVGGKIARHVDEDICSKLTTFSENFGILQGDIKKIVTNIQRGIQPSDILDAAIKGEDLGISLPLRGSATAQNCTYRFLRNFESRHQQKIDEQFERLANQENIYTSYD